MQGVAFVPNGNRIISVSDDWTIRVWDTATQHEIRRSWKPRVFGRPFGFPKSGTRFGGVDRGASEWLNEARLDRISLTISPDGKHLVCGRSVWSVEKMALEYFVDDGRLWKDLSLIHI